MTLLFQLRPTPAQGFLAVWAVWPRKEKKKDAEKAWNQKVTTDAIHDQIQAALIWAVPMYEAREPEFRPLLASWLRGEQWTDEPPSRAKASPPRRTWQASPDAFDQARRTKEVMRLMQDEGLTRDEAIDRVFKA